jgi:hypothetical protein
MTEEYENYEEMEAAAQRLLKDWDEEEEPGSRVDPAHAVPDAERRQEQAEVSRPSEEHQ